MDRRKLLGGLSALGCETLFGLSFLFTKHITADVTVLELLRAAADDNKAVLLVTHENDALDYADRVYRMNGGELTECEE